MGGGRRRRDHPGHAQLYQPYFPEGALARWLDLHSLPSTVYAFPERGVQPLRDAYRYLVDELELDAIVLVDGGTDILMRGDDDLPRTRVPRQYPH